MPPYDWEQEEPEFETIPYWVAVLIVWACLGLLITIGLAL